MCVCDGVVPQDDDIFFGIEKTPYARHYMGPPHSQVDFVPSPKPVTSPSTSPKELSPSLIQVSLEKDCYQPAVEKGILIHQSFLH